MLQQCYRTHQPKGQCLGKTLEMILFYNNHVLEVLSSLSCHKCLGFKSRTLTNRVKQQRKRLSGKKEYQLYYSNPSESMPENHATL